MSYDLEQLKDNYENIAKDVADIKQALLGSEFTEGRGMISKVNDHSKRLYNMEARFSNGKWLVIGLAAGSGVGLASIIQWIAKVVEK
jgi:hypothetical protein